MAHIRLLRSVKLKPARANRLTCFHGDGNGCRESNLPGRKELRFDCGILLDTGVGNLLPCRGIASKRLAELVVLGAGRGLEGRRRLRRGAANRVRERLVLLRGRCRGLRRRKVRALEVCCGEVGDALTDGRA